MIVFGVVLLLFLFTFFIPLNEGFEEDYLSAAIVSIQSAMKDKRMTKYQLISLEDALSYAKYIKTRE